MSHIVLLTSSQSLGRPSVLVYPEKKQICHTFRTGDGFANWSKAPMENLGPFHPQELEVRGDISLDVCISKDGSQVLEETFQSCEAGRDCSAIVLKYIYLTDLCSVTGLGKFPWRREQQPTPVFWPGEVHGQRKLAGYSPSGHRVRQD